MQKEKYEGQIILKGKCQKKNQINRGNYLAY